MISREIWNQFLNQFTQLSYKLPYKELPYIKNFFNLKKKNNYISVSLKTLLRPCINHECKNYLISNLNNSKNKKERLKKEKKQ